jgi:heptosyltransferase-1
MKRLLVIKPSSFGDVMHGLQVVQSLKEQRPDWHITWVVAESFAGIVQAATFVDEIIIFKRSAGLSGFWQVLKAIRARTFDYVWDMQGLLRSGIMIAVAKAKRKIGRCDARECAAFFYDQTIRLPKGHPDRCHAIDILLPFLETVGAQRLLSTNRCAFRDECLEPLTTVKGSGQDRESFVFAPKSYVVLFPDSRRAEKEWPYFYELTESLLKRPNSEPIIWAGQMMKRQPAAHWSRDKFQNLIGKTSLYEVIQLISNAKAIVANDSGPMHLAAALKVPVIALFGPTNPVQYGPYSLEAPTNHAIQAEEGDLSKLTVESIELAFALLQ